MRRATIRSDLDDAGGRDASSEPTLADARVVARAIRPDNTDEMSTRVERPDGEAAPSDADGESQTATIVTEIERETTGGLRTNVDDYVVNVDVATRVAQHAHRHTNTQS